MEGVVSVLNSIKQATVVANDDNIITSVNPACCRLFGYDECEEELVGKNILNLFANDGSDRIRERLLHNGEKSSCSDMYWDNVTGEKRDGSRFEMQISLSKAEVEGQCIVTGIIRDVSTECSGHQHKRLSLMVESSVDPIFEMDLKGTIRMANPVCRKVFLYGENDVIGENINTLMKEKSNGENNTTLDFGKYIGKGEKVIGMRSDGTKLIMILTLSEVLGDGEKSYMGILRDITWEERECECATSIVKSAIDPIVQFNAKGVIRLANPACLAEFHCEKEQFVGENVSDFLVTDIEGSKIKSMDIFITQAVTAGKSGDGQKLYGRRNDGTTFSLYMTLSEAMIGGEYLYSAILKLTTALEFKHTRMKTMIRSAMDPMVEINSQGIITAVNPACSNVFKYSKEDMIGKEVTMLIPEGEDNSIKSFIGLAHEGTMGKDRNMQGLRSDKTKFPMLLTVTESRCGDELHYIGIMRDLTTEEQERERMMSIVTSAIDPIVQIDVKGIIQMVNQACCKAFRYEEADLLGQNVKLLMPQVHAINHDQYLQNYMRTGQTKIIGKGRKLRGQRKDGKTFPLFLTLSEARIDNQVFFTGILRDLTEVEQERTRLTSMIMSAVDPIVQIDSKGIIQLVNPACCKVFLYDDGELVGKNVKVLMPHPHAARHDQYISNYLDTGVKKLMNKGRKFLARKKNGNLFTVFLTVSEARIGDDIFFTGIFRDLNAFHTSSYHY